MEVVHFPDDPRPPRWAHPVLALGNFDGLHRGHLKIIERIRRGATERGGTARRADLRSASAAGRAARQGAAAADDQAQKLEALDARRRPGRWRWSASRASCRSGSRRRSCAGARRLAARRGSLGRRRLPVRPRPLRQLLAAAHARRSSSGSAPRRSIRSATRISSSRSTRIRRLVAEGRVDEAGRAARPPLRDRRHGRRGRPARPRARVSRPPTWRPRTS